MSSWRNVPSIQQQPPDLESLCIILEIMLLFKAEQLRSVPEAIALSAEHDIDYLVSHDSILLLCTLSLVSNPDFQEFLKRDLIRVFVQQSSNPGVLGVHGDLMILDVDEELLAPIKSAFGRNAKDWAVWRRRKADG